MKFNKMPRTSFQVFVRVVFIDSNYNYLMSIDKRWQR